MFAAQLMHTYMHILLPLLNSEQRKWWRLETVECRPDGPRHKDRKVTEISSLPLASW